MVAFSFSASRVLPHFFRRIVFFAHLSYASRQAFRRYLLTHAAATFFVLDGPFFSPPFFFFCLDFSSFHLSSAVFQQCGGGFGVSANPFFYFLFFNTVRPPRNCVPARSPACVLFIHHSVFRSTPSPTPVPKRAACVPRCPPV